VYVGLYRRCFFRQFRHSDPEASEKEFPGTGYVPGRTIERNEYVIRRN
jgi:hypothetical protein